MTWSGSLIKLNVRLTGGNPISNSFVSDKAPWVSEKCGEGKNKLRNARLHFSGIVLQVFLNINLAGFLKTTGW